MKTFSLWNHQLSFLCSFVSISILCENNFSGLTYVSCVKSCSEKDLPQIKQFCEVRMSERMDFPACRTMDMQDRGQAITLSHHDQCYKMWASHTSLAGEMFQNIQKENPLISSMCHKMIFCFLQYNIKTPEFLKHTSCMVAILSNYWMARRQRIFLTYIPEQMCALESSRGIAKSDGDTGCCMKGTLKGSGMLRLCSVETHSCAPKSKHLTGQR